MRNFLFLILFIFISNFLFAQKFEISGEFRPRAEYRNLITLPDFEPIFLLSQRSRLNFFYENKEQKIRTKITFQDARVWGNTEQQIVGDNNSLGVHEAWCEVLFNDKISLKLGRQEWVYDDERLLGNNDFLQQSRSHDAALFKYENNFRLHIGAAYNQNTPMMQAFKIPYGLNNYKTIQFIHFQKETEKLKFSILFLNNGVEYIKDPVNKPNDTEIIFSQTSGFFGKYKLTDNSTVNALFYYQSGKDYADRKLSAYNTKLTFEHFFIPKKFSFKIGADVFSGNDEDTKLDENKTFTLLYGTNLLHSGVLGMYLTPFVPSKNSFNNGLINYLTEQKIILGKFIISNHTFFFNSLNPIKNQQGKELDKFLGFEDQLFLIYRMNKIITIRGILSYSYLSDEAKQLANPNFGTLENFESNSHQWFVLSLIVKPNFFTHQK